MCHFLPVYHLGIAFLGRGEGSKYNTTRTSQKFCNILVVREAQYASDRCFRWDRQGDELHWTMRFRACLILSKYYSSDLPQSLKARHQKPRFYVGQPSLIVDVLATRTIFPELSGYCSLINCAFTFRTTNHTRSEEMHSMSTYPPPQYYQPHRVNSSVWVAWYTCYKLMTAKILM